MTRQNRATPTRSDVGGQRQGENRRVRRSVDGGDAAGAGGSGAWVRFRDASCQRCSTGEGNFNVVGLMGTRVRQVQARAEPRPPARSGHAAALVVGIDRFELAGGVDQAVVECVQLLGPVEV